MDPDSGREALRRLLLARRDATSHDMLKIVSERVRNMLRRCPPFYRATEVGVYHSMGSEIITSGIVQELLDSNRRIFLPAILDDAITFRRVRSASDLVPGRFGTMEPKATCSPGRPAVLLVPAVGVALNGTRLGYGHGYYDRYISENGPLTICLTMEKQIAKSIPPNPNDAPMSWIVTESRLYRMQ